MDPYNLSGIKPRSVLVTVPPNIGAMARYLRFFLGGDSAIGGGSIIVNAIQIFGWKTGIYIDLIPALENLDIWFPFPTNLFRIEIL